jgi:proliferating cell nuclear antigen
MFKLTIENAKKWKHSIDAVVNLISEGHIEIGKDGISIKAMDPSQIAMVSFSMPKSAFLQYDVPTPTKIGVNFDNLSRILGRARENEKLEISDEKNKLQLEFFAAKKKRSFKVPSIDIREGVQKEPSITHDAIVRMNAGQFKETLKDAELVSSHITLEATPESFNVEVHGEGSDLMVESDKTSEEIIELTVKPESSVKGRVRATFPLQYLLDIVKACSDSESVAINLKSNAPIKIEYSVEDANIVYYLAPRIETE